MKILKFIVLTLLLSFSNQKLAAQQKQEEQIIQKVNFEADKIILNDKIAFNYIKLGNNFSILNLQNKEIISGVISLLSDGTFSSLITFVASGKQFSNKKIIGRNDLVFALAKNNVIKEDFTIDEVKLSHFFQEYNQLK